MRILIFSASTGGGHKRAAAALKEKINAVSPDSVVSVVDGLRSIGRVYDKTVCKGYYIMATKTPKVYGKFYKVTDKKNAAYKAVMRSNAMMSEKLLEKIDEFQPDVIIMCHAFISAMVSRLKRKGQISAKVISLITDYDSHRTYISPNIDAFVVAEPQMAAKLHEEYGVDESKIYPLGIPTFDSFIQEGKKDEICAREGLDPDKTTVLLMAGSFGVTGVLRFYEQLAKSKSDLQLIVITGRNEKLYEKFKRHIEELGTEKNTKLLFFVDNVQDYMHVSDLIVTKPGGLTVTESLACALPMAIYSAYPGQELDNVKFLISQNAAILIDKELGANQILGLLNSPGTLLDMKENCRRLARPNAAEDIYKLALRLSGKTM